MRKQWCVALTPKEDQTLRALSPAQKVPQRIKTRTEVVSMNAKGNDIETIAAYYRWNGVTKASINCYFLDF